MKERIKYLDLIRGIATIMIVIHHFNKALERYDIFIGGKQIIFPDQAANGNFGVLGVSLFFMISGASLMYVYKDKLELKKYASRRILSIFPLFYLAYIGAFIFKLIVYRGLSFIDAPKRNFIFTIIGMDGYIDYAIPTWYLIGEWFLGCIIIMYIIFPLLRRVMLEKPELLMIIGIIVYFITVWNYSFEISVARNVLTRGLDLLFGMYFVYRVKNVNNTFGILSFILLAILYLLKIPGNDMLGVTVVGILTFIFLVWASNVINNEIINSAIGFISKYSYGIFLTHHIVINCVVGIFANKQLSYAKGVGMFAITLFAIGIATVLLYCVYNFLIKCFTKEK